MPVTDTTTLLKELKKFGPENETRNERFIAALAAALGNQLLNYYDSADAASSSQFFELNEAGEANANSEERGKRFERIKEVFNTKPFQIGDTVFNVATEGSASELASVGDRETVKFWVTSLQDKLLDYYQQAPEDQRLQRLGEISFMFRAAKFGKIPIRITAIGVNETTDIAFFQSTYGCPLGTTCIDGNCV